MNEHLNSNPVRNAYQELVAAPVLSAEQYQELIDALHPVWVEEVVCPIHVAVASLHDAASSAADGDLWQAQASHQTAQARLYQALANAYLLTPEEELQEIILQRDDAATASTGHGSGSGAVGDVRRVHGWDAWRAANHA